MPIRAYSQREIRTGRDRLEKPLLLAVLLAQAAFCYADANWLLLAASMAAIGGSWLAAHRQREIYVSRTVLNVSVVLVGVVLVTRYITVEQELLTALDEGQLWFCDDQALNGEFPELETACRELGLSYTRQSEGHCQDAEVVDWRPDMEEPLVRTGSNAGDGTFVLTEEVRKALTHLESNHIGRARELLRTLCPDIPELPPFKIV